ncbi:MAG: substrate-binding domain-containing protein, partial [Sciscionella sp.]|nr:substrate-binding domain-containing protein [Sciscionella sp.]
MEADVSGFGAWLAAHPEALIGTLALITSITTFVIQRNNNAKVIEWRVMDDEAISSPKDWHPMGKLVVLDNKGNPVSDASMLLVRVKNPGREPIDHFTHPLAITVRGARTVVGAKIAIPRNDQELEDWVQTITDSQYGLLHFDGNKVKLPEKMELIRGRKITVRILLAGKDSDDLPKRIDVNGTAPNTRIRPEHSGHARQRWIAIGSATAVLLACIGILIGRTVGAPTLPAGVRCVSGKITAQGSTAFAPAATDIGTKYQQACQDTTVTVTGNGSNAGVAWLEDSGRTDASVRADGLAMSDGKVPANEDTDLTAHPVAIVIFSVVVNKSTGLHSLTRDQLRDIYAGVDTNWRQLGGNNQPIALVSRGSESGTRNTFEQKVLGTAEPSVSSNDCIHRDRDPRASVIRCERQDTVDLLHEVNAIPGAIGYAETTLTSERQRTDYPNVDEIQLDSVDASPDRVKNKQYPFWTVEYFYTWGEPPSDSPLAAFGNYLITDSSRAIIQDRGHIP